MDLSCLGIAFLFGACALLVLPVGAAAAGPCTTEIDSLTKLMAARDAGAGPTAGAAGTTGGQHPPTAAMGAADPSTAASSTAAQSAPHQFAGRTRGRHALEDQGHRSFVSARRPAAVIRRRMTLTPRPPMTMRSMVDVASSALTSSTSTSVLNP
jgi:hypothetical protein